MGPFRPAFARLHNILLTGAVGVGKTTVIQQTISALAGTCMAGFYTAEVRDDHHRRVGFRLVPVSGGKEHILAHAGLISQQRVGRYGVDVEMLNYVVDMTLSPKPDVELFVIDEIGKMECFSKRFIAAVERLLAAEVMLLATVAQKGGGLIDAVKKREDVQLIEVTPGNRNQLPNALLERLRA